MAARVNVQLYRDSLHTPWGFRLAGGADYHKTLFVDRVATLGPAEGEIRPGDQILAINGTDVHQRSHQDATELILASGSQLTLTIARCAASALRRDAQSCSSAAECTRQRRAALKTSSSASSSLEEDPLPQNKRLAGLMSQSLTRTASMQKAGSQSPTEQMLHRHTPTGEITDYLPRPGQRRSSTGGGGGGGGGRRETQMRAQVCDSLLRGGAAGGSGRSTPTLVEFGAKPAAPPTAIGVWTPPTHQPNARLVHLQYNSPLNMYTPGNVADMIERQTGTKLSWERKPPVRFLEDIRDSPTYKLVQEIESTASPSVDGQPMHSQSQTFKRLERGLDQ